MSAVLSSRPKVAKITHSWLLVGIGSDGKRMRCRLCGTVKMQFNVKNSFPVPKYTLKDGTILLGKAPACTVQTVGV